MTQTFFAERPPLAPVTPPRGPLLARARGVADAQLTQSLRAALEGRPANLQIGALGEITVHICAMPAEADDPFQSMRAVVLLSRRRDGRH